MPAATKTPVRLAESKPSPAQIYAKLFSSQEEEVVSAAEVMPEDKYNFAPKDGTFEGVRTFAQQVTHIAASQYYYFGNFGIKGVDSDAIDKLTKKDDVIQALRNSYAFAQQAIDTITVENAFEPLGGEHKATRAGLVATTLAHTNDHYGQLVVYLRMNGIIPPATERQMQARPAAAPMK